MRILRFDRGRRRRGPTDPEAMLGFYNVGKMLLLSVILWILRANTEGIQKVMHASGAFSSCRISPEMSAGCSDTEDTASKGTELQVGGSTVGVGMPSSPLFPADEGKYACLLPAT